MCYHIQMLYLFLPLLLGVERGKGAAAAAKAKDGHRTELTNGHRNGEAKHGRAGKAGAMNGGAKLD